MSKRLWICLFITVAALGGSARLLPSAEPVGKGLFARKNLVAWCIVPFDSKKRGPEERAAMLEKLGFTKFAYDYRAEHIPTFDAEIEALKKHHVELSAWWFPTTLNDEAKMTLGVFAKHKVTPQLWVTGGGEPTKNEAEQRARVTAEAARIRPIAEAAAKVGCKVALYNHGGWFGEPENQIAIIQELKLDNVGIVYNLHHGHDHLDRFPDLLKKMKPHLYALNLNGMTREGDRKGQKILQLGQGDLDLTLLKNIRDSGYTGPMGILGHTQDDAEERLQDNLDGLDWLVPQVNGLPAGPKPKPRTPVPQPVAAAKPASPAETLVTGKFGNALNGRAGGAFVAGRDEFHNFPITVECWTKLADKSPYNILVANEQKSSGTHWELFSMAGTGHFTVYLPGFAPDHCNSTAMICDNAWHHVAMILEPDRIRLMVDGKQVADQQHKRTDKGSQAGGLALASLVDRGIGCTGLVDEVRISKGVRQMSAAPDKPFVPDDTTIALWHLDDLVEQKRFDDASPNKNAALIGNAAAAANPAKAVAASGKIEGHWGEDAIGFRWTEADSRDDRFGKVDFGTFFSGSITGPGGPVYKGIVVRIGAERQASICYDTELLRAMAGWNGFLKFDPARFGIIVPPRIDGPATFATPRFPGVSTDEQFANFREKHPYGPLSRETAHYKGLYRNGQRVVLKYTVANSTLHESPWLETANSVSAITRTLHVGPSTSPIQIALSEPASRVRLHPRSESAALKNHPAIGHVLVIEPHDKPVTIKVLVASSDVNEAALDKLVAASPTPEDILALTSPGPKLWGEPLMTKGEVAPSTAAYVVDTITLPFDNPFNALFFCGGHDFLPDGRAAVCTLHGDVWLVDGIDESLQRITWRRFATGLFQPLGLKVQRGAIFVVGRDQITRLHDMNGDGEADYYENFNNDAHVTLNGHEYVTCLETDRAGNFYYVKGNCNSQTPHDGSMLRVTQDGSRMDVFATGFRNPNGIGMGPRDEITVAPQEGEWTPASAVFLVREGGFYGGMMSHHRAVPPTDFERPIVWFPRLADNSSGGQVWTTSDRWGPLSNQLLHMSYGQCRLRLVLRDIGVPPTEAPNGASIELPMRFTSGIHRGRMSPRDGQLYLTGLKGWTTSAVHDGCFQRVRYTGQPMNIPVAMRSYSNGIGLVFSEELDRASAQDPGNYQLEAWNYKWSAAYGSPEYRPSAPGQIGRDEVEAKSATLLSEQRTIFLELDHLKPVDQLSIGYTLLSRDGRELENTVVATLNSISKTAYPESELHRRAEDPERTKLLASLRPGIQIIDGRSGQSLVSRLAAWTLPAGPHEVAPTGSGPPAIVGSGWLRVPFTGRYRFSTEPAGVPIEIGDARPSDDGYLLLTRGFHSLSIRQEVRSDADAQMRLLWESNRFPREAAPPSALMHVPTDDASRTSLQTGARVFDQLRCAKCHQDQPTPGSQPAATWDDRAFAGIAQAAPRLEGIGSRIDPQWLAQWLQAPYRLRSDATMPAIAMPDSTVADLVAYLGTMRDSDVTSPSKAVEPADHDSLIRTGHGLYESLGCIACHSFGAPDQKDEWSRVSLHFAAAKYQPLALVRFLSAPQNHYPSSRMPDFRLTADEAKSLAEFVRHESRGRLETSEQRFAADPQRGKVAFDKLRCSQCHQIGKNSDLTKSDVAPIRWDSRITGCLAADPQPNAGTPWFKITEDERQSLIEFGRLSPPQKSLSRSGRSVDSWLNQLRCTACHSRDSKQSVWPEIVAEEGSGKPAESAPQLTWVGEKLQGPWMEQLLKGDVKHKSRPWLAARMPSFPAYAKLLAHGLAAEHGVPFEDPLPTQLAAERIELGRRLTQRDGGLDCRQCHGIGKEQPRGDASTQIALGINFSLTRDRLRPEFALRQMLDPPRYEPGSRMPRFAPDLKSTAVKQIANGDAKTQFEMLREFLWSVTDELP